MEITGVENFTSFHVKEDKKLIPEQLVAYILSYLNFRNVFSSSIVSKYLYKCSQLTTVVNITNFEPDFEISNLKKILSRFEIIKSLTIDNCKRIDNNLLAYIIAHAKSADTVKLEQFFCRDLRLLMILNGISKQVKSIKLSGIAFCQEKTRNFFTSSMKNTLQKVNLNGFRTLCDKDIENIFENSPNMKEATFEDCTKLKTININASRLKSLSFARCVLLEGINAIDLKALENFDISNCRSFKSSSFEKLLMQGDLKCLKMIDMRFCSAIKIVEIANNNPMNNLISINMEGCTKLEEVKLKNVPILSELKVGMCLALERISIIAPKLLRLDLSMMDQLNTINIDCKNLKKKCDGIYERA